MNTKKNTMINDLTQGPVAKQLILFSLPIMGATLLQALYTLVDLWAVGKFADAAAISAVAISSQIVFLIHAVGIGLANAGQVLLSQQVGARDYGRISTTIGTLLTFSTLAATAVAVVGAVGSNLWMKLLQVPAEAWNGAVDYLLICCLGTPAMCVCGTMCGILRGIGESKVPMYILAVSAVSNGIMDVIFVASLGWGAAGAAWATILAQVCGAVYATFYVYRRRAELGFDFSRKSFRVDRPTLKVLLKIGAPLVIMSGSVTLSMMVVTSFVNAFGVAASAISGIGAKLNSLVNVVTGSMQTSTGSMVGQNFAAGRIDRVRKINLVSNLICLIFFVFVGFAVLTFPTQIIGIFTQPSETEVLALAPSYMKISFWLYLAFCGFTTSLGHINGVGNTRLNLVIALVDSVFGRIGLSILLGHVLGWGIQGFWWGNALAAYISVFVGLGYYFFGKWEKRELLIQ